MKSTFILATLVSTALAAPAPIVALPDDLEMCNLNLSFCFGSPQGVSHTPLPPCSETNQTYSTASVSMRTSATSTSAWKQTAATGESNCPKAAAASTPLLPSSPWAPEPP